MSETEKPKDTPSQTVHVLRILALAVGYAFAGWFGLQLTVAPEYATIIWPASGVAVAGLLFFGPSMAIGVLLGSFSLNAFMTGFGPTGPDSPALLAAGGIALGSAAQALVAATLVRKLFGVPINFKSLKSVGIFALIVAPLSCLIAPTVGISALTATGQLPSSLFSENWLNWWMGEMFGICLILPLTFLAPWHAKRINWNDKPFAGLRITSFILLVVPVALTFYAWKFTSELTYAKNLATFEAIADDSLRALQHRMDSYEHALDGASGLIGASSRVTFREWEAYVTTLDIETSLPGISGIGFIAPVADEDIGSFLLEAKRDGLGDLKIHPETETPDNFVIRYISPGNSNQAAIGLNIAFEQNRYNAAVRSRDTGMSTITERIFLVQDSTKSAGFLLLKPVYYTDMPLTTVAERRTAFRGWVYAPFIGNRFMSKLTPTQGETIQISVFDGKSVDQERLIYASGSNLRDVASNFAVEKTITDLGQAWTMHWEGTAKFEASVRSNEPRLILGGGLTLSLLVGIYLLSIARRENAIQLLVEQKTREIAAQEEQTRSIVDTAVVAILVFDETGRTISANHAAEVMLKCGSSQLTGTSAATFLKIDKQHLTSEHLLARLKQAGDAKQANDKTAEKHDVFAMRRDGGQLHVDLQINSWTTEAGEIRYTAIVQDITQRRKMAIALEEAEERWSNALQGANMGVFDIDLRTGVSIVSDTWKQMIGIGVDEDISPQQEWTERVHPNDLPMIKTADAACFEGRREKSKSEYRIKHTDGSWRWVRSEAIVTERDERGKALRFVGTQTDITDLKTAEAQSRASEERLRSSLENAPIGMALIGLDAEWLLVNDALCAFLGYSREDLIATDLHSLATSETAEDEKSGLKQLLKGNLASFQVERQYIHKDGALMWGMLSVSLARNEDGQPEYFIAQILDISHNKEMDRLKSEFISNVSHELRTPLTSIRGSLGLIAGAMSKGIPEGVMRLLNIAHKNSERLILLINDILDLEKLEADKVQFDMVKVNVVDEVKYGIDANQGYADEFGVTLKVTTPFPDLSIEIDKTRFQQILSNLLSNASKFSPVGADVDVTVDIANDRVRVSVKDYGAGIPDSFKTEIFTPFSQADGSATRKKGGTGLGLHLSKQMAEHMNGVIGFHSLEGAGSTFWVEFPLTDVDAARDVQDTPPVNTGPRALHVEDDVDFSIFLQAALRDHVDITNAPTLTDAKNRLANDDFDILIIDVQLPDGNGMDLLDSLPDGWAKPIVVLTALDKLEPDPRVSQFIVKSVAPERQIIDAILEAANPSPATIVANRTQAATG